MFSEKFKNKLIVQKQNGLYRKPLEIQNRFGKYIIINNNKVLNFSSNDYLGLAISKKLNKQIRKNFKKYSCSSSSSRVVTGNYKIINQAEKEYAKYFNYEDCLFFPSGYQANLGLISALFEKEDTVVFDKHIHASSVKGISLSGANLSGYKHNSMSHLETKLIKYQEKQVPVITESLFSMDGDLLNIDKFSKLKSKYKFLSIVDEAHSFGVLGEYGKGIANNVADIAIGTFGKALGLFGAFVLLPSEIKEYLINFSSPQIYTTTLPEAHAATVIDILEIIYNSENERKHLKEITQYMKTRLKSLGLVVKGDAHIIAVEIGDENKAVEISKKLLEQNIFVFVARYPTVPLNKAILRISMSALHNKKDVDSFINEIENYK